MQAALTDVVNDGLDRADLLLPGHGFLNLTGGVTQDAAFGRLEAGAQLTDAVTAFGFGEVAKDFHQQGLQFQAGGGVRVRF